MLPRTGLYSDVISADKPLEPESIKGTTILTIPVLLVSDDAISHFGRYIKKYPHKNSFRIIKKYSGYQLFSFPMSVKNPYSHAANVYSGFTASG
jgi:hypothetical protein